MRPDNNEKMTTARIIGIHMIPDFIAETCLMAWNQMGMKYTMMKYEPPNRKAKNGPNIMLRLLKIRGGTVALSPFHT